MNETLSGPPPKHIQTFLASRTQKLDFGVIGHEGFYAVMLKPTMLPFQKFKEVWGQPDESLEIEDILKRRLAYSIQEWNLVDESGDSLPLPSEGDWVFEQLPQEFIEFVGYSLMQSFAEASDRVNLALKPTSEDD